MHRALWSGAGLGPVGKPASHVAIVSGDGRCSVVACGRLIMTVPDAEAAGISIGAEALTTVGRSVRARFTSVPLGVSGSQAPLPPDWGELGSLERPPDRVPESNDRPSDRVQGEIFLPSSAEVVGATGQRTPATLTAAERARDSALCDGLTKLRPRVQGGTLTRGQLAAGTCYAAFGSFTRSYRAGSDASFVAGVRRCANGACSYGRL